MTREVEDEVDWSDGTLDDPPSTYTGASVQSGHVSPPPHEHDGLDYLFEDQEEHMYMAPLGTTLPPTNSHPTVTRAQRARIGVHLNRRQPSEQDYAHFALYQANQKAYEATFVKHLVNHALLPSQIERCFQAGSDAYYNVQKYVASLSANINAITNKMVWNAHCRAVNLLANAGKDGAPFWDVGSFDRDTFAESDFDSPTSIVHKLNESWHRTASTPSMVRYTTRDYPIGQHTSPFEEIDEVADTLFKEDLFGSSLPAGRTIRRPTTRKRKGQGTPGARVRNPSSSSGNELWLASLITPAPRILHHESTSEIPMPTKTAQYASATTESRRLGDLRNLRGGGDLDGPSQATPTTALQATIDGHTSGLTQLERLYEEFGADALAGHNSTHNIAPSQEHMNEVPPWPVRLIQDHKRRTTRKSPQVLERPLPGIRAVIAEAVSKGYRPVNPDFEELVVIIEGREHFEASQQRLSDTPNAQRAQQTAPMLQKSVHSTKRRREQLAPIRMINEPKEPRKKKRKADASATNIEGLVQPPRKQKNTTPGSRLSITQPVRQKLSPCTTIPTYPTPLPPHPSGSATLEPHQHLPPTAYFTPTSATEQPAWRCGIKHAMGHYYNAGNRKNCPGCFTAHSDNPRAKTMDFYLPKRTYYHQPNPTTVWRPSKPFNRLGRARRSQSLSHNSIAKDAYWDAKSAGVDDVAALTAAIAAVHAHLRPKAKKEPPPPPPRSPTPDQGPHPSGSKTLEPTQPLPAHASFSAFSSFSGSKEEFAWRCDVNHALGRYYMAGNKRSCPGCGSNRDGTGKREVMDFYLPPGKVVWQDIHAEEAGKGKAWKARKPYRPRDKEGKTTSNAHTTHQPIDRKRTKEENERGRERAKANTNTNTDGGVKEKHTNNSTAQSTTTTLNPCLNNVGSSKQTHNQLATRFYWTALENGMSSDAALAHAIHETGRWVDEKEESRGGRGERDERGQRGGKSGSSKNSAKSQMSEKGKQYKRRDTKDNSTKSGFPYLTASLAVNALRSRTRNAYAGTDASTPYSYARDDEDDEDDSDANEDSDVEDAEDVEDSDDSDDDNDIEHPTQHKHTHGIHTHSHDFTLNADVDLDVDFDTNTDNDTDTNLHPKPCVSSHEDEDEDEDEDCTSGSDSE